MYKLYHAKISDCNKFEYQNKIYAISIQCSHFFLKVIIPKEISQNNNVNNILNSFAVLFTNVITFVSFCKIDQSLPRLVDTLNSQGMMIAIIAKEYMKDNFSNIKAL